MSTNLEELQIGNSLTLDDDFVEIREPVEIPFVNTEGTGQPGSISWGSITGKPATFTPSAHQHNQTDVIGLVSVINSLEDDITEIETDFDYATNLEAFLTPGL